MNYCLHQHSHHTTHFHQTRASSDITWSQLDNSHLPPHQNNQHDSFTSNLCKTVALKQESIHSTSQSKSKTAALKQEFMHSTSQSKSKCCKYSSFSLTFLCPLGACHSSDLQMRSSTILYFTKHILYHVHLMTIWYQH